MNITFWHLAKVIFHNGTVNKPSPKGKIPPIIILFLVPTNFYIYYLYLFINLG